VPLGLEKIHFRLEKVGVWQNCFTNGGEALFFLLRKKSTLAFLLYKIFCNSVKKHQLGPVLPLKATFFSRFGTEKEVLWSLICSKSIDLGQFGSIMFQHAMRPAPRILKRNPNGI